MSTKNTLTTISALSLVAVFHLVACSEAEPGNPNLGNPNLGNPNLGNETGGAAAEGSGGVASGGLANLGIGGSSSGGQASGGTFTGPGSGGSATGGASTGGADTGGTGGDATSAGGSDGAGGMEGSGEPVFHLFLLMGQSNMAGVAPIQETDKNTDERLQVWGGGAGGPPNQWNLANPPLHDAGEKGWNSSGVVGPGMWFAKTLLEALPEGHTIGLIGTAESGDSIDTFISGGTHHPGILRKIEAVKQSENARFSGIIFHQGESDTGQQSWPGKVVQLYQEMKAAFGVDYDVPFILGELPESACCGSHNPRVHEAAEMLPMGSYVTQDGTAIMDQYHFNHESVVLMGTRYGEQMIQDLGW
jgi:hypothetical protein